jgi:4'-phosphopantetheinyl transferase
MTPSKTLWRSHPEKVILKDNEVHLWIASLVLNSKIIHKLRSTLSTDEIERADRFHFQKNRHSFIAGRGILRSILAHYLENKPREIGFIYNTHGKPSIANMPVGAGINFNLSHSHGLAVYAFTGRRRIGIDIERMRSNLSFEKIANRFFTSAEFEKLSALAHDEFIQGFFYLWTQKEAYIKARGKGLSIPLNQFGITISTDKTARINEIGRNRDEECIWSFYTLTPAPGYVGTLAAEGKNPRIKYWTWTG